jgi:ABC-2 type transport system ATP-binding protein
MGLTKEYIISVSNVSKKFNRIKALQSVNLQVERGVFGLIGPNGAGKTTLIRILLGLIKADNGEAKVLNKDVWKDSLKIREQVGILHERPSYPSFMTPNDYLEKVSQLYPKRWETNALLNIVGLTHVKDRPIKVLSAGMYQRLGLAQSLIGKPEIVFLDEPTSNLDVSGRSEIIRLFLRLHKETGTSFFISSHVLSELERLCHNVAFIKTGQVITKGRVVDIMEKYTSNLFSLTCSDSDALYEALKPMQSICELHVFGVSSLSFSVSEEALAATRVKIEQAAKRLGIDIYDIRRANSLEEVFREVMRDA